MNNHFKNNIIAILLLFSIAPIWAIEYLPMVDLPQHAGQIKILNELLFRPDTQYSEIFFINWFTPYITGYLLCSILSIAFSINVAIKLSLTIYVITTFYIVRKLLKILHSDENLSIFILPSLFSASFYWGFLNFLLAIPIGLLFLYISIKYNSNPTKHLCFQLCFLSILLFFSHILVLCFFSLLSLVYHWLSAKAFKDKLLIYSLPYAISLPLVLYWLYQTFINSHVKNSEHLTWMPLSYERYFGLIQNTIGLSKQHFIPVLGIEVLLAITIVLVPFFMRLKITDSIQKRSLFITTLLLYFLAPNYALGTGFLYHRVGGFLLIFYFCCFDKVENDRYIAKQRASYLAFLTIIPILFITINFFNFANESPGLNNVFSSMESNEKVLMLVIDKKSKYFAPPVYLYLPAWYQTKKNGIVDFNFASFFPQPLKFIKETDNKISIKNTLVWNPINFNWDNVNANQYRYFVIHSSGNPSNKIFKDHLTKIKLLLNEGKWWLYESIK